MLDMPYFMENEEWYTVNPKLTGPAYVLTNKAPKAAVTSYDEYYAELRKLED